MKLSNEAWRAVRLVRDAPGGGMHRAELAELLDVRLGQLWDHLGPACGLKLIDFCRDYVVTPARP
jgi:hypothetical protein